jgi:prolyl-tRNA synthetase
MVANFADSVERQLLGGSTTFLLGDAPTAADILISVWLASACHRTEATVCKESHRLLETLLTNAVIEKAVKSTVPKLDSERKVEHMTSKPAPPKSLPFDIPDMYETSDSAATVAPVEAVPALQEEGGAPVSYPAVSAEKASSNILVKALQDASIPAYTYEHKLSTTADELLANVPLPANHTHTKNLLFKDKKHGLFLVTARPTSNTGNTKFLGKALNLEGKVNLRLADAKTLDEVLGAKPGCVGPMSIMNDKDIKVTLVLDEGLLAMDYVHSHPLINDMSCAMKPSDLINFCKTVGKHEPVMIAFEDASADAAKKDPGAAAPKKADGKAKGGGDAAKETGKNPKVQAKKGETLLALQWKKEENFPEWYSDVITLSEMIGYYNISGCYILRPWSYKIWELMQEWFNKEMGEYGVENCYFPLFVSKDRLEKEKDHVEGFAAEVAWVTKSGDGDLAIPIAIRPTSETIMYPSFSDWIKSHRDLPLLLNQWSNVVRWEFKYPTPFLRSREFLWQEGHTVHATHKEAEEMVMVALEWYRTVYEDLLAVPVMPGYKTEKEKFAGGHRTTTVEAYIPSSGRAIQGATSHDLGQNFGKMFDITFQSENGKSETAWQTSFGLTTRTIGVMVMVHGDDSGLVMPPRVAPLQCVIVPIVSKKCPMEKAAPYCEDMLAKIKAAGIRVKFDGRSVYNPGWKYNHWEQKGVPIRLEVGPRDMESGQCRMVVRHNKEAVDIKVDGDLGSFLKDKLDSIQKSMFEKAKAIRDSHVVQVTEWKDFVPNLEKNNLVMTPWVGGEHQEWEEWVKEKSRAESLATRQEEMEDDRTATSVAAKTLCIPFKQPELPPGTKCIASKDEATCWILWGRSY